MRDGADEDAFLAADARFQTDVIYQQPGIARRTTARRVDGDGGWLVCTLWNEVADAEAAPQSSPELDAFIDPASVVVTRYEELPG